MPVVAVGGESPFLAAARDLAADLRHEVVPPAAWRSLASEGRVLVALTEAGDLAGYLVACPFGNEVRIVDLLVVPELRFHGIARGLVETLFHRSSHFVGLTVLLAADADSAPLWPRLGFEPVLERGCKSSSGAQLHCFRRDLGSTNPKLRLSLHPAPAPVAVTLDAPVFFELVSGEGPLAVDWLQDLLSPHLPPDIKTAISRSEPPSQRIRLLQSLPKFAVLAESEITPKFEKALQPVFSGARTKPNRQSVRALAASLAAGHSVFLSEDSGLLAAADALFQAVGALVLSPQDVVGSIERIHAEPAYQPQLVHGRGYRVVEGGERETHCTIVSPAGKDLVTLSDLGSEFALTLNQERPVPPALASTLARHLLGEIPGPTIRLREAPPQLHNVLLREGFEPTRKMWRANRPRFAGPFTELAELLGAKSEDLTPLDQLELERKYWPAHILDGPMPTYILPIPAPFAQATWDVAMAAQDLFWDESQVRTYREWVHVLTQPLSWLEAPARILWYAQPHPRYPGSGAIRASSLLLETCVNTPAVLSRRYRRFGAFSEAELLTTARGDVEGELMALHCGWLNPLLEPLTITAFGKLAESCGESPLIRAPRRIGPELAMRILLLDDTEDCDE